mgnify:FL=1
MEIIYQDSRVVVAVKPAGILSTDEPGGMPSLLRQALNTDCIRTVHRLDAQTGGVMVFARSRMAASLLSQQVRERQFSKCYLAAVHGTPQPQSGEMRDLLGRDSVRRVTYVADTPSADTREALLTYETLDTADGLSLVRVQLHTGRTHQIRVQFTSRGLPLAGDRKYGIPEDGTVPLALWAYRLSFAHPQTGQEMSFTCPPPETEPWTRFKGIMEA